MYWLHLNIHSNPQSLLYTMNEKRHHMSDVRLHPQAVNCEEDATVNMERTVTEEIEMSPIGAAHEANKKDTIVNMEPGVVEETVAHSSGATCEVRL